MSNEWDSLIAYEPDTQSIIFKEWKLIEAYEYAKDKILVTTMSNVLFLVQDFCLVKLINDESYNEICRGDFTPLPNYDEENFPFILIGGCFFTCIMNVKTGEHKPLLNSRTIAVNGMSCTFAKREEYGFSIHWTTHFSNSLAAS